MAEYSGKRQIAVDCRRLRQSRGWSLVVKLVEQVDVCKVLRRCPVTKVIEFLFRERIYLLKSNSIIKLSFFFSFTIRFTFTSLFSLRAKN